MVCNTAVVVSRSIGAGPALSGLGSGGSMTGIGDSPMSSRVATPLPNSARSGKRSCATDLAVSMPV